MKALLDHTAEEAVELAHACLKLARGDKGEKNVTDEAADVAALLAVLAENEILDAERYLKRFRSKLKKFRGKYGRK
jgi:NTP pyrophosphatase (non-canonical NTP hydrolase)